MTTQTITYHRRVFDFTGHRGWGFSFECDAAGNVDAGAFNPAALDNYRKRLSGEHDVVDRGIQTWSETIRLCSCGSGEVPEAVHDARGIYVASCCCKCRSERLSGFRADIFADADYWTDEPVEADA